MKFLKTVLVTYSLFGFDFTLHDMTRLRETVVKSYLISLYHTHQMSWLKYFKHKTVAASAAFMGTFPPPVPEDYCPLEGEKDHVLLGGAFYRFTRELHRSQRFQLGVSILNLKGALDVASKEELEQAEADNVQKMSTKPRKYGTYVPCTFRRHDSLELTKPYLKKYIDKQVKTLFRGKKFRFEDHLKVYLPSVNSNYTNTREELGTLGIFNNDPGFPLQTGENYISPYYHPDSLFVREDLADVAPVLPEEVPEFDYRGEPITQDPYAVVYNDFELRKRYNTHYEYCIDRALDEQAMVQVMALAEPLKIRTISKGPPWTYYVLKPLQKFLLKSLQSRSEFVLTGTPVTDGLITSVFGFLPEGTRFLSGDYSAATDNMYRFVSKQICKSIGEACELPEYLGALLTKALIDHIYLHDGKTYPQRTGQLMGSIVSFPVLCIANYCAIKLSQELSGNEGLPFLINGDDNVSAYKSNSMYVTCWNKVTSAFGFFESIGKTYDHESFLCINSRFFVITPDRWFVLVPFINFKCLSPWKDIRSDVISAKFSELLKGGEELADAFLYFHSKQLSTFRGSYRLPPYLGGLGLKKKETDYTYNDFCIASYVKKFLNNTHVKLSPPMEKKIDTYGSVQRFLDHINAPILFGSSFEGQMPLSHLVMNHIYQKGIEVVNLDFSKERDRWWQKIQALHRKGRANGIYFKDPFIEHITMKKTYGIISKPFAEGPFGY